MCVCVCAELSLGPLSLTVDNVTNTTLTLSWLPPDMTIINSTTADLYYTVMYDGMYCVCVCMCVCTH